MQKQLHRYLELLSIPLLLLVVYISIRIAWNVFSLPPAPELTEIVGGWLVRYGLPVLFLAAMAEGMLLVGGYFPGVFVITVAVVVARSWQEAVLAIAIGSAGLMAAHIVNYQLGRHGWYRILAKFGLSGSINEARQRLERRGPAAVFATYWLPSLSSLTDTAAGIMGISFRKFLVYALAATIFWNAIAGSIMYYLGSQAIELAGPGGTQPWIVLSIIGLWMLGLLILDWRRGRKKPKPPLDGGRIRLFERESPQKFP